MQSHHGTRNVEEEVIKTSKKTFIKTLNYIMTLHVVIYNKIVKLGEKQTEIPGSMLGRPSHYAATRLISTR